jgi:PAS domain S-box-containing protein
MIRLNIAAKVWLSIGIFLLGFVFLIALEQVEGRNTEDRLSTTAEALFPAALLSQRADAAFGRTMKGFRDAVVVQDASGLDSAEQEGRQAVERLRSVAAIQGLSRERRAGAAELASSIERFLADARRTYGPLVTGPRDMTPGVQKRMAELASRTQALEVSLRRGRERFSDDLKDQLTVLQGRSARMRWLGLVALATSLLISAALVNLTIRRSITGPLLRAEAELARERDLLRILLDNIPDCIYFKDAKSRFIRVNKAHSLLLGIGDESAANGRTDFDFFDLAHARQSFQNEQRIVRSGQAIISQIERVTGAGGARWLTSTKVPVKEEGGLVQGIVCVSRDITEWKEAVEALQSSEKSFRLLFAAIPHAVWVYDPETLAFLEVNEAAVRQAQRLEAVGQLAAGIAHEINTPIQYVSDNLRFLQQAYLGRQTVLGSYERLRLAAVKGEVSPVLLADLHAALENADAEYIATEIPKATAQALDGVERVAGIVRAMREFAHPGAKEKATADLNRALANALIVARNEYKYVADAETDFGDLPQVVCNIAEMNQVFLNLLVNAAHAIGEVTKGTETRGKIVVKSRQAGDRAAIYISDTGCGIPASIRSRIFGPFFTTKQVGRGSGQGLAIARSIVVEKHGGSLTFEPNGAQGTTFVISVPIEPVSQSAPEE